MEPIKYSDLVTDDGSLAKLIKDLGTAQVELQKLLDAAKKEASALKQAIQAVNPTTAASQQEIVTLTAQIEKLSTKMENLAMARQRAAEAQRKAKEEAKQASQQNQRTLDELSREYTETSILAKSYDDLSKAYREGKAQLNQMTAATQEETKAREQYAAVLRRIYEQMNILQQQTGKYQLQVGNYAKSWNGLNIAFQQIVREVPNMAMGFNTFFLAISNNIPILSDQIVLAKQKYAQDLKDIEMMEAKIAAMKAEAAEASLVAAAETELNAKRAATVPVGKQILSSLFSWQTALLAGVTILTMYGGKLAELISGWLKGSDALSDMEMYTKAYNDAAKELETSAAGEVAALIATYEVATDVNAAMEDRIGAAKDLQDMYPDIFSSYTTEQIMVGDTADLYDELANSILRAALAEGARKKIAEAAEREVDAQIRINRANETATKSGFANVEELKSNTSSNVDRFFENTFSLETDNINYDQKRLRTKEEKQAIEDYEQGTKDLAEASTARAAVIDYMKDNDLFGFFGYGKHKGGGRSGSISIKEDAEVDFNDLKYIRQQEKVLAEGIIDDREREKALLKINYKNRIEDLENFAKNQAEVEKKYSETLEKRSGVKAGTKEYNELTEEANKWAKILEITKKGREAIYGATMEMEIQEKKELEEIDREYDRQDQDRQIGNLEEEGKIAKLQLETVFKDKEMLKEAQLRTDIDIWEQRIAVMKEKAGVYTDQEIAYAEAMLAALRARLGKKEEKKSFWDELFGWSDEDVKRWGKFIKALSRVANETIKQIKSIIDAYEQKAKAAEESAQAEVNAANTVYEAELEAYKNGYANNVEFARKELEARKQKEAEAAAEVARYEKLKQQMDTLSQASSLTTASAELFKATAGLGPIGVGIATAAIGAMFSAFITAKVKASQLTSTTQYGDGMHEYLDYGGTHASGNDIDFGVGKNGKRRRVERGEMIAVFNARNTRKYGPGMLGDLVDAINHGTFENTMSGAFASNGLNVSVDASSSPYLAGMASDITAIRKNGERVSYVAGNGTIIEKYRNHTRIKHIN